MSTGKKISLGILCAVVAFVAVAIFIAPRFVQLDRYRPGVISYIELQTGRRVEIGHLALSILPEIAIQVDHFAISNPQGFPSGNWLAVKRIDARLNLGALLHRQIVIRALKLENPVLDLVSNAQGRWNYQVSAARGPIRLPLNDPPPFTIYEISKLILVNGRLSARELQANAQPGASPCDADGLSIDLRDVNTAELNALGVADSAAPAAGGRESSAPPFRSPRSATGDLSLASLRVANLQATHIESSVQVSPAQVHLDGLHFSLYGGQVLGAITLDLGGPAIRYQAQAQWRGVNVEKLLAEFPSTRGQMTGTLDGRATFSGEQVASSDAWEGKQGEGVLTIRKGRWPKFRLDRNLLQLAQLAQLGLVSGNPSAFSLISANWQLARGVITTSRIHIVAAGVTVNGSGTADLARDEALDFQGVADMAAHRNLLSNFLANVSGATFQGGRIKVPFVVSGTLRRPVFHLKAGAL